MLALHFRYQYQCKEYLLKLKTSISISFHKLPYQEPCYSHKGVNKLPSLVYVSAYRLSLPLKHLWVLLVQKHNLNRKLLNIE